MFQFWGTGRFPPFYGWFDVKYVTSMISASSWGLYDDMTNIYGRTRNGEMMKMIEIQASIAD